MHKRKLHHLWVQLRGVRAWYLIAALMFSLIIFVFSYRQNNLRMIELREAVFAADEAGEDVEQPLRRLREFVHGHMNTDLASGDTAIRPPLQLTGRYERLLAAEEEKVKKANEGVYAEAERVCEARFPAGQLTQRASCVQEAVTRSSLQAKPVPKELYQFDFISPRWSPDLAGFSLLAVVFFGFLLTTRVLLGLWLRSQLS